jgi:hypothetical protein
VKKSLTRHDASLRSFLSDKDDEDNLLLLDFSSFVHSQLANKVLPNDFEDIVINALAILEYLECDANSESKNSKYLRYINKAEVEKAVKCFFREFIKVMAPVSIIIYKVYGKQIRLTLPEKLSANFTIEEFELFNSIMNMSDFNVDRFELTDFLIEYNEILDIQIDDPEIINTLFKDPYILQMYQLNKSIGELK